MTDKSNRRNIDPIKFNFNTSGWCKIVSGYQAFPMIFWMKTGSFKHFDQVVLYILFNIVNSLLIWDGMSG